MKQLIESFISAMEADGKSNCTVTNYRNDLNQLSEFFRLTDVSSIKYSDLRNFVNDMVKRGLSSSTRARKISAAKSFFRYLTKMDIIEKNPAEFLETPKLPKKEPKVINTDETVEVLECSKNTSDAENISFRDYTMISLFLFTGIRRGELVDIRLTDVNMDNREILIHGKGNKERKVFISNELYPTLKIYLEEYRDTFFKAKECEYLFISKRGNKISLRQMNNIIDNIFRMAEIKEDGLSVHALRKRFATTLFENTRDIATVSKILGHSSPAVTMRYVAFNEDNIRKAVDTIKF